ncbi:MAG: T9SS type A sorting domain-containing protein [Bacteroidetes bacterium]|nr:T9SS type A sorting domain-containing protein [Bacteroidota bacterium]
MKKFILFIILFFCALVVPAQNELTKWYFGNHAALDFMTDPPTVLNNSAMYQVEGSSSIADATGNLLFYTNGRTIWNKYHAVMDTGLLGHFSTAQSALIVKQPNNLNLYYVFTMAVCGDTLGLNYSIVDMSLAAGAGSVIAKNIPLYSASCTEQLAATKHANGVDCWIMIHELGSNNFRAYLLTAAGLNATAVISSVGTIYPFGQNPPGFFMAEAIGYMKFSHTGAKVASCMPNVLLNWNDRLMELYDFNNSTGIVSNPLTINVRSYDCEFSPDGTKFYSEGEYVFVTPVEYVTPVIQWDLNAGSNAAILSSSVTIAVVSPTLSYPANMKLAPNGKIYILESSGSAHYFSVINNPNALGAACSFSYAAQSVSAVINPTLTSDARLSMPNMLSPCALYITGLNGSSGICNSATTTTASLNVLTTNLGDVNYRWSNGTTTYTTSMPQINNLIAGHWSVTATNTIGCAAYTTFTISQYDSNIINISSTNTDVVCAGNTITLTASGADTYTWNTSQTGASITVTPAVTIIYAAYGTDEYGCESSSNQILVSVSPCTGVDELENGNDELKIYPNPVNKILNVESPLSPKEGTIKMYVYDILGNVILNEKVNIENNVAQINISALKSGMYFIKIGNATQKFVKE